MSNILIGLKRTCLGVSERGDRAKDNETGLKEGEGIKMSTTMLPFTITIITTSTVTQLLYFNYLIFLVYTVWAC